MNMDFKINFKDSVSGRIKAIEESMPLFHKQYAKLLRECRMLDAKGWLSIPGARLNSSYWETPITPTFEGLIAGLKSLGVDFHAIPKQTKWYEFWKSSRQEREARIKVAIGMIKL